MAVNNITLNDPKINAPSASLDVKQVIRSSVDRSEWQDGMGVKHFIGYWSGDINQDEKLKLLELQGKRVIIYGERVKNTSELTFQIYKYYPYTTKNIQTVIRAKKKVEHATYETYSPIIFLILLLFPLLKFGFCFAPTFKKGSVMDQFVTVLPYLLVIEFGLYLIYEDIMPSEYNIRIDLMFIYPALFFSTVISIWLVHKQSHKYPVVKK